MFRKEQIEEANAKSLIDYVLHQGLTIKKTGKDYKIEEIGGGLYIDIDKNRWHWWGTEKGGGPIQFVMEMENKTWIEAIKTLLNIELSDEVKISLTKAPAEKGNLQLPEKDNTMKHLFAYLTKTRGISSKIIQEYVDAGLLYQSKLKNCVFLGKDEKKEVAYAFLRGTNSERRFLMDAEGSRKEVGFTKEGTIPRAFVFESAIDLLSYQTLLEKNGCQEELKAHFISLGGVEKPVLDHYLKQHPEIKKITLCLDNDEKGRKAAQRLAADFGENYQISRHKPKAKDFNMELTELLEEEKQRERQKEAKEEAWAEMEQESFGKEIT